MAAKDKNSIELARIMRKKDSLEGVVFSHLQSHARPQAELVCETLRAYWLPLALKLRGVKGFELKSQAIVAIAQLMQQIEIIRLECGLRPDEMPFAGLLYGDLGGVVEPKVTTVPRARVANISTAVSTDKDIVDTTTVDDSSEDEEDFERIDDSFQDGWGV
ncbi:MAG: hypothetical protein SAK29_00830 [Scytonema sp. PMC 1069.18]|nr:hypothetical protein [Scytonema sp. PMC 1069.18]MEC4881768.1 hypothetical protein [Scytonema sp. PMC 1070.18]